MTELVLCTSENPAAHTIKISFTLYCTHSNSLTRDSVEVIVCKKVGALSLLYISWFAMGYLNFASTDLRTLSRSLFPGTRSVSMCRRRSSAVSRFHLSPCEPIMNNDVKFRHDYVRALTQSASADHLDECDVFRESTHWTMKKLF